LANHTRSLQRCALSRPNSGQRHSILHHVPGNRLRCCSPYAFAAAEPGCRAGSYCPVASRYLATTSAGTRPRSLMSIPRSLAQARTAVVSMATALRRPLRAARRVPPALRACAMNLCRELRSA